MVPQLGALALIPITMSWYYAEDGTQKGPITDDQFQAMVASGQIKSDTLVWRSGMPDWKTWGEVIGSSPPAAPESLGPATEPSTASGSDDSRPIDADAFLAGLRARGGYSIKIDAALSKGWDVVRGNFWPAVGITLLIFVIQGAMSQIPCVGAFGSLFLSGPLMGGLYYYFLLQVRGHPATINEAFAGFKQPKFVSLMLTGLLVTLIQAAVTLILVLPVLFAVGFNPQNPEVIPPLFFLWLPIALIPAIYLNLIWQPVLLIVMDTDLSLWNAMEFSRRVVQMRFWSWLLLVVLLGLIAAAGFLALCIGLLVTMPLAVATLTAVWDDVVATARAGESSSTAET